MGGLFPVAQTDDAARDMAALLRAYNRGDVEGAEVILANADLALLARTLASCLHELMLAAVRGAGTAEEQIAEVLDQHLAGILAAAQVQGFTAAGEGP